MLSQPRIDIESPVVPVATFDPPAIRPGEVSTYRVTLNALETAIEWPGKIPAPEPLACRAGAHGQILAMIGAFLVPRTTFNYRVRPTEVGRFTIPRFTVTVNGKPVTVPATQLEVVSLLPPGIPPAQQLFLDLSTNTLFVGETIRARVLLPGSMNGMVQSLGQVQVNGEGFIVDQSSAHARIEAMPLGAGGRNVNTFVYELMLTPIATGKISIAAQGYAVGNRVISGIIMPGPGAGAGALPQYTLLDSVTVPLEIRPLPRGSELPGFTGAVGNYTVDAPELATNVLMVGEPVKLRIRVHGDGNLARLVPPQPPRVRDWQVFPASPESIAPQLVQVQSFVTFSYTLIPRTEKTGATPSLSFSAFNPERGAYVDLSIPSIPVTVTASGATAMDLEALDQAENHGDESEKEPILSGLAISPGLTGALMPVQKRAWFPLLHLAPASMLLGLWLWDRRRRFLETHPDVVRRRRALRALRRARRALERAAHSRDSVSFAAVAVDAMKVAVAPHYPAEPRALVGTDVITLLPDTERSGRGGEVVRHLFARTDAARFAAAPLDVGELLTLQPEIEGVLDYLEARLCS